MEKQDFVLENAQIQEVKVRSIKRSGFSDVYCLSAKQNNNFIANGIIIHNCDALRYLIASEFPDGEVQNERESWTIDKWRREMNEFDPMEALSRGMGF